MDFLGLMEILGVNRMLKEYKRIKVKLPEDTNRDIQELKEGYKDDKVK